MKTDGATVGLRHEIRKTVPCGRTEAMDKKNPTAA